MARPAVRTAMKEAGAAARDWIVEAAGVGRRFAARAALASVDLRVRPGEIFGLVGPDGAGKTTLMQIFAAILDPTEGACRVLGFDTVSEAERITARVGYMSQGFTLYDRLTVDENLEFAAGVRGISGPIFAQRRATLLRMAGLERFAARRAGRLSGGMRKKLALCTNLVHEPPLLLLDEPSLGVDPLSRHELWGLLRGFRARGIAIVLATAYMDEAADCDRVAFLHSGRVLAHGTPAELSRSASGSVYELHTQRVAAAQEALADAGPAVGLQWREDRVRFQLIPGTALPRSLQNELEGLGTLREAEPDLESAFVALLAAENGTLLAQRPAMPDTSLVPGRGVAVSVDALTVRFGEFTAVDAVSFTVEAGEVVGWLGPNGAGKTTLIRALCALLQPAAGDLRVAGLDPAREGDALKPRIGYMSQHFSLYPDLTVEENLVFFAGVYGLRGRPRREAVRWASETTGLGGTERLRAHELSGAMRQRLALACAVMHRPAVLFLDEPTSGVDPLARQRFWALIRSLAAAGMAVLVTTHYLDEARYCHRLGLMSGGRLIALGSLSELRAGVPGGESLETAEQVFIAYIERDRAAQERPG